VLFAYAMLQIAKKITPHLTNEIACQVDFCFELVLGDKKNHAYHL